MSTRQRACYGDRVAGAGGVKNYRGKLWEILAIRWNADGTGGNEIEVAHIWALRVAKRVIRSLEAQSIT